MITRYLARRGLRVTLFGEFMLSSAGLLLMGLLCWLLIVVLA